MMYAYFNALDSVYRLAAGRNPSAGITLAGKSEWQTMIELDADLARYSLRRAALARRRPDALAELPSHWTIEDA